LRIAKFSAGAIPVDRETKTTSGLIILTQGSLLYARSAGSLEASLTAGKNVAGFAPIGGAVGGASLVDPSDRGPERGAALSRSSPKRVV
jgi:hypothetical protein